MWGTAARTGRSLLRQAAARSLALEAAAARDLSAAAAPGSGPAWRAALAPGDLHRAEKLSFPAGVVAGVFGSVAGSGGAAVVVPLLRESCPSIPQRVLAASSLLPVLLTAITSTTMFAASGCVDPLASACISAPAVAFAPLGARLASRLDSAALKRLLGWFLVLAAPLIPFKSWLFAQRRAQLEEASSSSSDDGACSSSGAIQHPGRAGFPVAAAAAAAQADAISTSSSGGGSGWVQRWRQMAPEGPDLEIAAGLACAGAAAGFFSSLLGIGGGTIAIPLVALLLPVPQAHVLGTTLLAMIPPTTVALLEHHRLGNVHWRLAALLSGGAVVGAVGGSAGAVHAPPGVLEACFSLAMLVLARMTLRPAAAPAALAKQRAP